MMNIRIEFRYAVLASLIWLLWLATEYMVGLNDKYIAFYPYSSLLALIIPLFCWRRAMLEKREILFEKITFKQAFISGLITTAFASVFAIPVQLVFHKLVNPDFFDTMIHYSFIHGNQPREISVMYYNINTVLVESVLFTFVYGLIVSLVLAWQVRTVK